MKKSAFLSRKKCLAEVDQARVWRLLCSEILLAEGLRLARRKRSFSAIANQLEASAGDLAREFGGLPIDLADVLAVAFIADDRARLRGAA